MLPETASDNPVSRNLLTDLPDAAREEMVDILLETGNPSFRIERIVSHGQCSPPDFWYDQDEHEWILLLQGQAEVMVEDTSIIRLVRGSSLLLPAGWRHRVHKTAPDTDTVWLAVFFSDSGEDDNAAP